MTNTSSRLDGVNAVLDLLGYQRVAALGAGGQADVVERLLQKAVRELQDIAWWFNWERFTPTLSARGFAHLPEEYALPEDGNTDRRFALKSGRRLYDAVNRTYVWDAAPTNLVSDPFDPSAGSWAVNNLTVAEETGATAPCLDTARRGVYRLTETAALGDLTQDIAAASFSDGQEYVVSAYVAASAAAALETMTTSLRLNAVSTSNLAVLNAMTARDPNAAWGTVVDTHNAYGSEVTRVDVRPADGPDTFGWHHVSFRRTYSTGFGDMQLFVRPNADAATGAGIVLLGGVRVSTPADFPLGAIDVLRIHAYEDLPRVAQVYAQRRAAEEAARILNRPAAILGLVREEKANARGALFQAEQRLNRRSMLDDSPLVRATLGGGRLPALRAATRRRTFEYGQ